jgi:hypothetical protein
MGAADATLLPFRRQTHCPGCGAQATVDGLCRDARHLEPGDGQPRGRPDHLHISCGQCSWVGLMETQGATVTRGAATGAADGPPSERERRVDAFIHDGRLETIPARQRARLAVLRCIVERTFEAGREYPEREVNAALAAWHPDVASLRRYLVDERFMRRAASVYELLPPEDWPEA